MRCKTIAGRSASLVTTPKGLPRTAERRAAPFSFTRLGSPFPDQIARTDSLPQGILTSIAPVDPLTLVLPQLHSPDGAFADAAKVEVAFMLDHISDLCEGLR